MHSAGKGGNTDIGANILYEYSRGRLGSDPVWSAAEQCKLGQTNCFAGTGAIIKGLNDQAGSSLYDVGDRLNIARNGCSYPPGYAPEP